MFSFPKVAVRVRPLNGSEVEDKSCTEIVHVLDENVSLLSKQARGPYQIYLLSELCYYEDHDLIPKFIFVK